MHTAFFLAALFTAATAAAADIRITVRDTAGNPVEDAVVVAAPASGMDNQAVPPPKNNEIIDQIKAEFVPRVKAIQAGSAVTFPNKDNFRHQVYSFSPAKVFDLPLYAGTPAKPVLFDKPGVVVLGCNIHDWMVGYVYVSESPWYVKTGADGTALLRSLPAQRYNVRVWHPLLEGAESATLQSASLAEMPALDMSWSIRLRAEVPRRRPPPPNASHAH